jgi:hypothetical protein
MEQDVATVLLDLLTQLPVLAAVWLMFIRPQTDSHAKAIEYYRQRQKETDEWMRRMMEVWSGERLDEMDVNAQKKIPTAQTPNQPDAA